MITGDVRREDRCFSFSMSGDQSDLEPPDLPVLPRILGRAGTIPNSEVKRVSVDASATARSCESRSSPGKQNTLLRVKLRGVFCGLKLIRWGWMKNLG